MDIKQFIKSVVAGLFFCQFAVASPSLYRSEWTRVSLAHGLSIAGLLGADILVSTLIERPTSPNWTEKNSFDEWGTTYKGNTKNSKRLASTLSDIGLYSLMIYPVAIDSVAYAGIAQKDWDFAWQTSLIHVGVLSMTDALTRTIKKTVKRARPDASGAGKERISRFESFVSGHSSLSFASAAHTCALHLSSNLYRSSTASTFTCGASSVIALATALFRIRANVHYATDTIAGAAIGVGIGYLLPNLLFYHWSQPSPSSPSSQPAALTMKFQL